MKFLAAVFSLAMILQEVPSITVDVRLQQVVATVRDKSGKIVKGLRQSDFIVEEDGAKQTIAHFSDDPDEPISLGVLIDSSGSMGAMPGGTLSGLAAATGITRVMLKQVKPDDEIALMTFSNGFAVPQSFTKSHANLEGALSRLRISGNMNVLAALPLALQEVRKSQYSRRALIVMTDAYFGGDVNQVASGIRGAEVPIFGFAMRGVDFGLQHPPEQACTLACHQFEVLPSRSSRGGSGLRNLTQELLDTLANESGGRSMIFEMHPRDTLRRVTSAIDEIASELRGQYVLGYYLASSRSGANRSIRVRTVSPDYRVYTRREDRLLKK